MVLTASELEEALRERLAAQLDDADLRVTGAQRLSGGASRDTWSVDCARSDGAVIPCIVRRERGTPPGRAQLSVGDEAVVITAARQAGVPAPEVIATGDAGSGLGAAYVVLGRIEGETLARRILRDDAYTRARGRLVDDCAGALARIHAIPVAAAGRLRDQDPLGEYRAVSDAHGEPHPAFELAFRWLEAHRPAPRAHAVVHGDFRLGNLIVGTDGLRAVLDWELAHLGDPVEDLGWLCVPAWRFGGAEPVAGVGGIDQLLDAYARHGGAAVDADELRWWVVMGTLRWGVICLTQAATHLSGVHRSVELAAIGRRACQVEWDLLRLLEPVVAR